MIFLDVIMLLIYVVFQLMGIILKKFLIFKKEKRKDYMLTIYSFLQRFKNLQMKNSGKNNIKQCFVLVVYAMLVIIVVIKSNSFNGMNQEKPVEAYAKADAISLSTLKLHEGTEEITKGPIILLQQQMNGMIRSISLLRADNMNLLPTEEDSALGKQSNSEKSNGQTIPSENANDESQIINTLSVDVYNETTGELTGQSEDTTSPDTEETMAEISSIKLSTKELEVLERIVEAEATGEDIKGKILVANVILNRVNDENFPDTVEEVVFQKTGSTYQFSPIKDKRYWSVTISKETKEAIQRVLKGEDYSKGALYFSAREKADESNMRWFDKNLKFLFRYGGHEFFKNK